MRFFSALMPRETRFFALFNRHAAFVAEGGRAVAEMVRDYADEEKRRRLVEKIGEIERSADKVTYETVSLLHTTFITPFDRDDIHRLITRMDDVMDYIESAAIAVMLYELTEMTEPARQLADVLVRSTESVAIAVGGLRTIKHSQVILEACIEVNRLENEGDEILRAALADLFRGATDPLLVLKWKEVYDALENATDRCEDVANIIEGVVLEHA